MFRTEAPTRDEIYTSAYKVLQDTGTFLFFSMLFRRVVERS